MQFKDIEAGRVEEDRTEETDEAGCSDIFIHQLKLALIKGGIKYIYANWIIDTAKEKSAQLIEKFDSLSKDVEFSTPDDLKLVLNSMFEDGVNLGRVTVFFAYVIYLHLKLDDCSFPDAHYTVIKETMDTYIIPWLQTNISSIKEMSSSIANVFATLVAPIALGIASMFLFQKG